MRRLMRGKENVQGEGVVEHRCGQWTRRAACRIHIQRQWRRLPLAWTDDEDDGREGVGPGGGGGETCWRANEGGFGGSVFEGGTK